MAFISLFHFRWSDAGLRLPGSGFSLLGAMVALFVSTAHCQDTVQAPANDPVQFGITGHYRIGCWTAIRLNDSARLSSASDPVIVETLDGDGMRVEYQQPQLTGSLGMMYAVPGSEAATIEISSGGEALFSGRFPVQLDSPPSGPSVIPLGMPWIVSVGDPLAVDKIGANRILNRDARVLVSKPEPADFPDSVLGYDGVDLMMITGGAHRVFRSLNQKQTGAIRQWVLEGGRVFVTLGGSADLLGEAAPWLFDLLPVDSNSLDIRQMDPSAIETYTSTQQPLDNFDGVMLPRGVGRVLITGRTVRRVSAPLAAEYVVGLGRVTAVAADLDGPEFATWPDRLAMITRLTGTLLKQEDEQPIATNRATAFSDLAGQMRATLDQFPLKREFGFSIVALILLALIAAIGPLDYLLINRVFGRPLLGWVTFPLAAVALSGFLVYQARPATADRSKSDDAKSELLSSPDSLIQCNRLEVIDIDSIANVGRGFAWGYLYSHDAKLLDVSVKPGSPIEQVSSSVTSMLTYPFGYPGRAFGGIQLAGEDARFPGYRVLMNEDGNDRGGLTDLALAPRSSKSIAARFSFAPDLPGGTVMKRRRGSELLKSGLANPFPFDLLDGMLIYKNWVYLLPTRFPVGSKIETVDSLHQKNFRWQLSRQTALEKNKTESEKWNASRFDRPDRVTEMLLFHGAVGGTRYTLLKHQPLSTLDLSTLLTDQRCMLVGRVRASCLDMQLTPADTSGGASVSPDDRRTTIIRLLMPVEATQ